MSTDLKTILSAPCRASASGGVAGMAGRLATSSRRLARIALPALALQLSVAALHAPPAAAIVPLQQYADPGAASTAGQLNTPSGVAVDSEGTVYVAEANRVSVFGNGGSFLHAFGKDVVPGNAETGLEVCTTVCKGAVASDGAGELDEPNGIAMDSADNLYVPETSNARVSVFTSEGAFLRAFGKDVVPGNAETGFEVCTTECQAGVQGQLGGELVFPSGAAVHEATLYVGDFGNHRITAYTPGGEFLRAFGKDVIPGNLEPGFEVCTATCKVGVEGGGPGELRTPMALATDATGNLYVADSFNNRVSIFTPAPTFLRAFGKDVIPGNAETGPEVCTTTCKQGHSGTGAGELAQPLGAAVDVTGAVYVGDQFNHRISAFTAAGAFLRSFGADVVPGNAETGFEVCVATCKGGIRGTALGELAYPRRLALDCRGALYVVDSINQRVQRFGEPGAAGPPCQPAVEPPAASDPSNGFSFGEVRRNKRRGTAKLTVILPGPGELALAGTKRVKAASHEVRAPSKVKLRIRPRLRARLRLNAKGEARVRVLVTYIPIGGTPNSKSKRVRLRKVVP